MFFLNRKYYLPILENCIDEEFGFNMWTYSRIDTVRPKVLETFKKAGVNWLALGVEAGNQMVRQEVSKGSFQEVNIRDVCETIQQAELTSSATTSSAFRRTRMKQCSRRSTLRLS